MQVYIIQIRLCTCCQTHHFSHRKHHQIVLRGHHSYLAPFLDQLIQIECCCTYGGNKVSPLNFTIVLMSYQWYHVYFISTYMVLYGPPPHNLWSFRFSLSDEVQFMLLFWLSHICFCLPLFNVAYQILPFYTHILSKTFS